MRIKIQFPTEFSFTTNIPVRISDINYGAHVGNDSLLSILHEARLQWLAQWEYNEMDAGGVGLIMADCALQYKGESFYGDVLTVQIGIANISSVSFDLFYKVTTQRNGVLLDILFAKTGMLAFNYMTKKITEIPETLRMKMEG